MGRLINLLKVEVDGNPEVGQKMVFPPGILKYSTGSICNNFTEWKIINATYQLEINSVGRLVRANGDIIIERIL